MSEKMQVVSGSASCPKGFTAAGMSCGIKEGGKPDLSWIACAKGASAAGVFTTNLLRAAPVTLSANALKASKGVAKVVLTNSGCANAATGEEGERRARSTIAAAANAAGCAPDEVLVMSTGLIGSMLASEKIEGAIPKISKDASAGGLMDAARGILTTDASTKTAEVRVRHEGRTLHVSGIAKGSGMIHPNMATMLSVILTDARVEPGRLDQTLRRACDRSFHRITVDGDTSTNDTVLLLASGEAGEFPQGLVDEAVSAVARALAIQVVADGEGARKLVHVRATGALDAQMALGVARTVASSLLVRTAIAGGDPNWGRIVAAAGRADSRIDMARLRVDAGPDGGELKTLYARSAPVEGVREVLAGVFAGKRIEIVIDLGLGDAGDEFFTCDLTEGYIRINSSYST
ncbi:MAG: bifunctional glutamate N-acetyltransferase/amino-acid acetyltransferase ArgJ [Phycisphaerales bacterium]